MREDLVTAVINWAKNRDLGTPEPLRLAMMPALMRELKDQIKVEKMSRYENRLIWCISVFAFWGSLRVHEILSVKAGEFTRIRPWSGVTSG